MRNHSTILFTLLAVLCAVLFVVDIAVGSVAIPLSEVMSALLGGGSAEVRSIVLDIRLVRAVVAVLAGAALSVSGLEMQVLFRNPLAGPYVLGVSAGASFGVALFLLGAPILGLTISPALQSIGTAGAAWIGAAVVLMMVVALSHRIKDIMVMLILGMMLSSGVGAVVEIMQYFSNEASLKSYVVWTMGSLGDVTATQLAVLAPIVVAGLAMAVATIKPMNMLLAGERYAASMGLNISRSRTLILTSTTLLAGTITAFCGPVGFVGIAVPHIARMLFRSADHRTLLPATILSGVVMMLVGDILAKYFVLPINTITALMGIPIVVYIVTRRR
ncbi:MAG: iron ABC transporter permease [Rikenellaceae bacterium]|nr:iron ABC transporter permease [Rikenellaceae bacterium]